MTALAKKLLLCAFIVLMFILIWLMITMVITGGIDIYFATNGTPSNYPHILTAAGAVSAFLLLVAVTLERIHQTMRESPIE